MLLLFMQTSLWIFHSVTDQDINNTTYVGISARPVANSVSFHKFCVQENNSLVALPVNKCWHYDNHGLVVGNYSTVSCEHQHTAHAHFNT